ncbi:MAG: hypothetical protein QOJ11_819 [Frankiales bacterium]|jgi:hypothetical protein|nr:hypothetical protein [Frankiales bacterium]
MFDFGDAAREDALVAVLSETDAASIREAVKRDRFAVASTTSSPRFGDVQTIWRSSRLLVRLTRDRGQWFADVRHDDWDDWFDIDDVAAAVPGLPEDRDDLLTVLTRAEGVGSLLPALRGYRDRRRRGGE